MIPRRLTALAVCLVFLISLSASALAVEFPDVSPEHWAYHDIQQASDYGLIQGLDDGTFRPEERLNRASFVTILQRMFGWESVTPATPSFTDVSPDDWYYAAAETALAAGVRVGVTLPRICWDREREELDKQLEAARSLGVTDALVGTLDLIAPARDHGFTLRGDFGLSVFNSQAIKELKRLGFASCTASFELKLAQIRDLSKLIDLEVVVYGRLPLMITENCILKNRDGGCKRSCEGQNRLLVDRKGERFPVLRAPGARSSTPSGSTWPTRPMTTAGWGPGPPA